MRLPNLLTLLSVALLGISCSESEGNNQKSTPENNSSQKASGPDANARPTAEKLTLTYFEIPG